MRRCRETLPLNAFNRYRDGHQAWCRECFRRYFRERGDLHRRQSGAAKRLRRKRARDFVASYLAESRCADCQEDDPVVLEFDHVGLKRGHVNRLVDWGSSIDLLESELKQCEVVCVNCHRRRTAIQCGSWRLEPHLIEENPRLTRAEIRNMILIRESYKDLAAPTVGCVNW